MLAADLIKLWRRKRIRKKEGAGGGLYSFREDDFVRCLLIRNRKTY